MKYFIKKESLDSQVIGSDYPQAHKFIKGYDPEAPNGIFGFHGHRLSFPEIDPNLDGIMLAGYAKKTDFISSAFGIGHIVSENAKKVLEKYNLCRHRFYPLGLYIRKVKHDYYLFKEVSDYSEYVDYQRSTFTEYDISKDKRYAQIAVESKSDLLAKKKIIKEEKNLSNTVWGETIVMNKEFDRDLDFFVIRWLDSSTYVSERLMNAILESGLTGWEFIPATNLVVD